MALTSSKNSRKKMEAFCLFIFVSSLFATVIGDRVKQKIYIDLDTQSACFRILNSTHEVGCTSSIKGNVGTVHYLQDPSDFDWILSNGPHSPYVAVIDAVNFTGPVVRRLTSSSRVNGILVINIYNSSSPMHSSAPEGGFSTQDKCPNDAYGMYARSKEYKSCQKGDWNPAGTSLGRSNLDIPVFILKTEKDVYNVLHKCFFPFNADAKNGSSGYPVCAAEVKSRMDGAENSVSCLRRTNMFHLSLSTQYHFCDPLGDKNVAATLMERDDSSPRENNSVILVASKLDSTSLFINEYFAADTTAAGMVTLLASAEALWKVKDVIRQAPNAKDILYTFFQGETFDYIGSSRMVYDMRTSSFPSAPTSHPPNEKYLPQVKLQHLHQIVELNQVGRRDDDDSLWLHTDPLGKAQAGPQTDQMVASLRAFGQETNVSLQEAGSDLPLPPASAQSFLKHRLDIPTVVITDHRKAYTNQFYNSRFDRADWIHADDYPPDSNASAQYDYVTKQAKLITDLSTTLARYLFKASTGIEPNDTLKEQLVGDNSTITHLLYCFLKSPNCELFLESVQEENAKSLTTAKAPFTFYVSVSDLHTNELTQIVSVLLARFTGDNTSLDKDHCSQPGNDKRFSYLWMQGAKKPGSRDEERDGLCVRSTVFYSLAKSPAFDIDGYDMSSGEYSTWTESVWSGEAFGVRLFLVPSPQLQMSVLFVGLAVLGLSLLLVYFCQAQSDILFSQFRSGQVARSSYNPMT